MRGRRFWYILKNMEIKEGSQDSRTAQIIFREGTITKIFVDPKSPGNQNQIEIILKCLKYQERYGCPPPGFPRVMGLVTDEAGEIIGYEQERILGQNLRDYIKANGKLSPTQAERLFKTLVGLQETFGQPHGDLGEGSFVTCVNILVVKDERGEPDFYFIDYGGTPDYAVRSKQEAEELIRSERRMLLSAFFLPRTNGESPYVEGDRDSLLEMYRRLTEEYVGQ